MRGGGGHIYYSSLFQISIYDSGKGCLSAEKSGHNLTYQDSEIITSKSPGFYTGAVPYIINGSTGRTILNKGFLS